MDPKSLQVKGEGNFTILSVNHRYNYLAEEKRHQKADSLELLLTSIKNEIDQSRVQQEVLKDQESLLNQNKFLGSNETAVTLAQLKLALDFFYQQLAKIKEDHLNLAQSIETSIEQQSQLKKQLALIKSTADLPGGELELRLEIHGTTTGRFDVSYLVGQAGWFPKYDIRVKDVASPIELNYKAEVYQNTGNDWKEVKLKFSNADPNQSGQVPKLNPWYLNYKRNTLYKSDLSGLYGSRAPFDGHVSGIITSPDGGPLPGVNVLIKGTTLGTVTDANGRYNLTAPGIGGTMIFSSVGFISQEVTVASSQQNVELTPDLASLQEVVVTGYGLEGRAAGVQIRGASTLAYVRPKAELITTTVENQTTVEIIVDKPYTIKSEAEQLKVNLKKFEVAAIYQYFAVPKLDKDAFLMARIINWDQYNLLEGEANLYFEDAFVGRSILDARSLEDTLDISLGRDRSIVIARETVDQFTKKKFIGGNKVESRGFKIQVRNQKNQEVNLTLFDQVPVASISDIIVTPTELSSAVFDQNTGAIHWKITLNPKEQRDLVYSYQVKYPKKEQVLLE